MSVANSRATLGAIFGAISTLAHTTSNSLDALNEGISMLNRTVTNASARQEQRAITDQIEFEHMYKMEAAQRIQEFNDTLEDWTNTRPGRVEKFAETLKTLETAIESRKTRK